MLALVILIKNAVSPKGVKLMEYGAAQVFDAPGSRKGLIGGLCVALVAIVGFVVLVRGGGRAAAAKRAARRKREEAAL